MSHVSAFYAGTLLVVLGTCGSSLTAGQVSLDRASVWPEPQSTTSAEKLFSTPASSRSPTTNVSNRWFDGFALPVIDGGVTAILPWRGGVAIGGRFDQVGGIRARNIAFWDGARWHALADGIAGEVNCLGEFHDQLIAGGTFNEAGNIEAKNIALWNGTSWSPLGDGVMHEAATTAVHALTQYEGDLIVGGVFDHAGPIEARGVARWDGQAWSAFGGELDFAISFAVFQGKLYAGGRRGPGAPGALSVWNGQSWEPVDGASSMIRYVLALAVYNERLIVAGRFDTLGSVPARNIAAWDGVRWDALGTGVDGSVRALAIRNDTLVAGGWSASGWSLGHWDGIAWQDRSTALDGAIQSMATTDDDLWVGGYFRAFARDGLPEALNFALENGGEWANVGPWEDTMKGLLPGLEAPSFSNVECLARYRDGIVAGGTFRYVGDPPKWNPIGPIALWNGEMWTGFPELPASAQVHVLLSWGDTLVAGGAYLGPSENHVAVVRLEGDHWVPMDTLGFLVESLAQYRGQLYASGRQLVGLYPEPPAVCRWDGSCWRTIGVLRGLNPSVGAMLVYDDRLVVAGNFTGIGTAHSLGLVAWDGGEWTPIANLPSVNRVSALVAHEGHLVVGGSFSGTSVLLCDSAFVQPLGPNIGEVKSLASMQEQLFAGVAYRGYGGGVLTWDREAWVPLDGGVNRDVESLLAADGYLYVGGAFTTAGTHSSFGIARWDGLSLEPDVSAISALGTGVPNPFRHSATFAYQLETGSRVRTTVLDLGGREIAVLEDTQRAPGIHSLEWDGRDERGRYVRPGVYFVRAQLRGGPNRVWRVVRLQ